MEIRWLVNCERTGKGGRDGCPDYRGRNGTTALHMCWEDGEACEVDVPEGALNHTCSEPGTPGGLSWQRPPLFLRGLANPELAA